MGGNIKRKGGRLLFESGFFPECLQEIIQFQHHFYEKRTQTSFNLVEKIVE